MEDGQTVGGEFRGPPRHSHTCTVALGTCSHVHIHSHAYTPPHALTCTHHPYHKLIHTHSLSLQGQGGARPPRGWWVARHPRGTAVVPSVQASKGQDGKSEKRVRQGRTSCHVQLVARADTDSAGNSEEKTVGDPRGA